MNKTWHDRIKDLRQDHDKKQKEVAEGIRIRVNVYQRYENGERLIPIDKLIMLADYYNVSTDYVLGRTDDSSPFR